MGRWWMGWPRATVRAAAVALATGWVALPAGAQEWSDGTDWWPARFLVDAPTAGLVPSGAFETRARMFPGGGVGLRLDIGLANWITVGGSFGGLQVIGDGEPDWYPEPAFAVKVRVVEESFMAPAIAIGVDTEGAGFWDEQRERYQYKSRGAYLVLSKNYAWLGDLSVHGGIGRSFEEHDDKDPSPFVGFAKSLGPLFSLNMEFDLGSNDNRDDGAYGKGRGYLNAVLAWSVNPQMEVRAVIRDMLGNAEAVDPHFSDVVVDEGWGREFALSYAKSF